MPTSYNTNTTTTELVTDYTSVIKGKVILTTGVTLGSLGGTFVQSIAKANPACLILAGRNLAKLDQCGGYLKAENPSLKIITVKIDLGSLASVRNAAEHINTNTEIPAIDVLVNNAGIMAVDYALSDDRIESQFATNHLGPFLFTNLIMGKVLKSESPRIVMVTSDGHRLSPIRFDDCNFDVSVSSRSRVFFCLTYSQLDDSTNKLIYRAAKPITDGSPMAKPKQPICSWHFRFHSSLVSDMAC
jgi:NAD(P)-dependent dehydrogenase (short-subunit alcohol dehydrogenase family)